MLPFLEPKKMVSVIIAKRGKPDLEVSPEHEAHGGEIDSSLKAAAEDLMRAIESKSVIDLAKSLKSAFDALELEPHEEGPHIGDE